MNDQATNPEVEAEDQPLSELATLKARADVMGIKYANKIGVDALKKKISDHLNDVPNTSDEEGNEFEAATPVKPTRALTKEELYAETYQQMQKDEMKLVRIRVTCLNPRKADLKGEIFCVANKYLGIVKKYIPFGEGSEDGYHVPNCLYTDLKDRKFLSMRSFVNRKTNQTEVEQKMVPEFAVEVLPDLTEKELADLAKMQAAREGL
jgi:hypothetical protein